MTHDAEVLCGGAARSAYGDPMARHVHRWELSGVEGAVVVVDVIRAFSTAAYAFGAGAAEIYLVATVDEALAFKAARPGVLAMGEDGGLRPDGFDFPNSPAMVAAADLDGRTLVQRTSAGSQGVVGAVDADRMWAASLVVASATARAVNAAGLGEPTYVITGAFADRPERNGADDIIAANAIESIRGGRAIDALAVGASLLATAEAARTITLGADHCHPDDIEFASRVDAFDFAMEAIRNETGVCLRATA
jgi:2-phosphosulfolactate phosphatase